MTIAVFARNTPDNSPDLIKLLYNKLKKANVELIIFSEYYQWLKTKFGFDLELPVYDCCEDFKNRANVMISLGGDGTMLETLRFVRDNMIPVLGVNTGRLGFLASVSKDEFETAIDLLLAKKYDLDQRSIIEVKTDKDLFEGLNFAVNEVTIHKKDSSAMISIDAFVDGEFLNSYWADGLIVCTATGSTAYSLSCGGPIIIPGSGNFAITPIAPHNLNVRPIVFGNNHEIVLKAKGRNPDYLITLDSRSAVIDNSSTITIRRADFTFDLIKLEGHSFFTTLRNKLLWGLDKRN
jgi:NAD+ kinase